MKKIFTHTIFIFLCALVLSFCFTESKAQTTIWSDPFNPTFTESFSAGSLGTWVATGTAGNLWTYNAGTGYCANGSAKCTPFANYNNSVDVYLTKSGLTFAGLSSAQFRFMVNGNAETSFDYLYFQTSPDGVTW